MTEAGGADGAIRVERRSNGVAILTLNRPEVLNALSLTLIAELAGELEKLEHDPMVGAAVVTGAGRAFAAGADIKEMGSLTTADLMLTNPFSAWDRLYRVSLPLIAAVNGFALGGGCELAMACDIILAAETATFGQPEINLGIIPGAGGTQRLPRRIGRYQATELILTGGRISAAEAYRLGLVNRVLPEQELLPAAVDLAERIARQPRVAVRAAKQALRASEELPLSSGLEAERRFFYGLFSTADQREGMLAFVEKRPSHFVGR